MARLIEKRTVVTYDLLDLSKQEIDELMYLTCISDRDGVAPERRVVIKQLCATMSKASKT